MTIAEEISESIAYLSGKPGCICGNCVAARLIERLAGKLAEACAQIADMSDQAVDLVNASIRDAQQLAARDAELKVCVDALERMAEPVTSNITKDRRREWAFRRNLAFETLAKLDAKEG